jgi:SAM-dependent methyltransferase
MPQPGKQRRIEDRMSSLLSRKKALIICPACGQNLNSVEGEFQCSVCARKYPSESGIPLLFLPNEWDASKEDVTEVIKSFYEETPFPNYEDADSIWRLKEKAEKGVFARLLDEQIPLQATVLEVGCGTGQLSNFLAIRAERAVFATDICLNSLKLGQEFKERNQLGNLVFLQMNLFRPVFKPETFDVVIGNGVLHHTSDPFLGFKSIAKLVKRGGFIIVGLYNKYGRLTTDMRRFIFRISDNRFQFLDPRLKESSLSDKRKRTWFMDQYKNPHESKHTIGEILEWFKQCGFEFINSIPKAVAFESFSKEERLFEKKPSGTKVDHLIVQLNLLFTGGREGGFFIMIGCKQ